MASSVGLSSTPARHAMPQSAVSSRGTGMIVGATLGGNLTPIGASANIAAIGILQKEGYEVKASDFLKIGVPFTLLAVLSGYLYCWFVWA